MNGSVESDDAKLLVLARSARARAGAPEGAAVRDENGRSYVAVTVALPSLEISALRLAVATAVAGGARGLEAAAVVSGAAAGAVPVDDLAALRDLGGPGTPLLVAGPDGTLSRTDSA